MLTVDIYFLLSNQSGASLQQSILTFLASEWYKTCLVREGLDNCGLLQLDCMLCAHDIVHNQVRHGKRRLVPRLVHSSNFGHLTLFELTKQFFTNAENMAVYEMETHKAVLISGRDFKRIFQSSNSQQL